MVLNTLIFLDGPNQRLFVPFVLPCLVTRFDHRALWKSKQGLKIILLYNILSLYLPLQKSLETKNQSVKSEVLLCSSIMPFIFLCTNKSDGSNQWMKKEVQHLYFKLYTLFLNIHWETITFPKSVWQVPREILRQN